MGKNEKATGMEIFRRWYEEKRFSPEHAARMFTQQPDSHTTATRTDNGQYSPRTVSQPSSLEIQRAMEGGSQISPTKQDVYETGSQDPQSTRDRKPKYNNRPPRGGRR